MKPAEIVQRPREGPIARLHSRIEVSHQQTAPTTIFGLAYSMYPQSGHTSRVRLSPSGTFSTKEPEMRVSVMRFSVMMPPG